jgi:hypothetical protein
MTNEGRRHLSSSKPLVGHPELNIGHYPGSANEISTKAEHGHVSKGITPMNTDTGHRGEPQVSLHNHITPSPSHHPSRIVFTPNPSVQPFLQTFSPSPFLYSIVGSMAGPPSPISSTILTDRFLSNLNQPTNCLKNHPVNTPNHQRHLSSPIEENSFIERSKGMSILIRGLCYFALTVLHKRL